MAPPSALSIATQSVTRLVKEESYYHKEQANQEKRIQKLQGDIDNNNPELDSNAPFMLKQEVCIAFITTLTYTPKFKSQVCSHELTWPLPPQQTALEETKKVFGPLVERITEAVQKLEEQIAISESDGTAPEEELKKAKEALEAGKKLTEKEE